MRPALLPTLALGAAAAAAVAWRWRGQTRLTAIGKLTFAIDRAAPDDLSLGVLAPEPIAQDALFDAAGAVVVAPDLAPRVAGPEIVVTVLGVAQAGVAQSPAGDASDSPPPSFDAQVTELADDLDWNAFSSPAAERFSELPARASVKLDGRAWSVAIPAIKLQACLYRPDGSLIELALAPDRLHLDFARERAVLLARADVEIDARLLSAHCLAVRPVGAGSLLPWPTADEVLLRGAVPPQPRIQSNPPAGAPASVPADLRPPRLPRV